MAEDRDLQAQFKAAITPELKKADPKSMEFRGLVEFIRLALHPGAAKNS